MEIPLAIILAGVIIVIGRWYIKRSRLIKCLERFPGPKPLPLIGNSLDFASPTVLLPKFEEYKEKFGGIVTLWIGPSPSLLLINDYDFFEFILSSAKILEKSEQYDYIHSWLGDGLLLAKGGPTWKAHRKIITPAFHFQILEQFVSTFENQGNILVAKLKKELGKPSVDIHAYVALCALDIICETAMGTSINAQDDSESEYVKAVKSMCRMIMDRSFNALLRFDIPYYFSSHYRKERKAVKILHEHTNSVIQSRKAALSNSKVEEVEDDVGIKKKVAFLDLLLKENANNQNLTDREIREEVDTLMFAGHDTTASAMSFSLYCLSEHPEVQQKVVEELQSIYGEDKFRSITIRDLQEMKYLECVIKEVLRLYPSVPLVARRVHEDIEYNGATIPKGMTLTLNLYGLHRNPQLFSEPEKFDPDRFSTENSTSRFPYRYVPFSAGLRNCIGQKFAMLEMKTVITVLLRNYELLPTIPRHKLVLSAETVLSSGNGICVRLAERNI